MTFLSWPAALLVAGIALPLFLVLYFLKLKRVERKISSTLLWKKAIEDLQVNAPFQKLRKNLLFFVQLLLLLLLFAGIAHPVANLQRAPEKNIIVLVDNSGSMSAREADGRDRLDHARDAARQYISGLPDDARAMVISFADRAGVACTFTNDKRRLKHAVDEVAPTAGPTHVGEALQLAVAYSSQLIDEGNVSVPQAAQQGAADLELFSDGRIADADKQFVTRGSMRYYRIGQAADNVGIVAFDVRRDFERPGILSVFVQVQNFGPAAVKGDLAVLLDGKSPPGSGAIREIALGPVQVTDTQPALRPPGAADALSSSQNVVFELQHQEAGVLEVQWYRSDALAADNVVFAPLEPPRPVRILVVCDRAEVRPFFEKVMGGFQIESFEMLSGSQYESLPEARLTVEGRAAYDLVIFDNHDTDRLPPGSYIFFGGMPKIEGVSRGEEIVDKPLVFGQQSHPLLRSVNYDGLYLAKWRRMKLPSHAQPLLEGEDSVVMAMVPDGAHRYVIGAFDLLDTDFPLKPSFPIFLQNAISYLASGGLVDKGDLIHPGDTFTLSVPPGATNARVTRPDGSVEQVGLEGRSGFTYARTKDTGVYRVAFDDAHAIARSFAVNLLDANESNIVPAQTFSVGKESVATIEAAKRVNEPLWPYAAAAAILLLVFEWWLYNRRVMI